MSISGERPAPAVLVVGSLNADYTVALPHLPAPGETLLGGDLSVLPGGKGANQAVAAARAGGRVSLCGAVGQDAGGALLRAALTGAGVNLTQLQTLKVPTGAALISVARGGENTIAVAPGANARVTAAHLPGLSGYAWLLLQQELPPAVTLAAARAARRAGVRVALNAAPARATQPALLRLTDLLLVNAGECAALAARLGYTGPDLRRQMRTLVTAGPATVCVTRGRRGSLTLHAGRWWPQPAHRVRARDTTGAGDTFAGVLVARLAVGETLPVALRAASVGAALACRVPGAQAGMPLWSEIERELIPD